ncbi:hypothetical protein AB0M20_44660, partial [Actinoplanes sp. NPDC051633]|uniref:hypothetical protein n=1 Tax=Actinoplanes sp. NPDC051633 TaxID=3155670 RepID=UPI00343C8C43
MTRLMAADRAASDGGPEHIDILLDLALHDPTEVQTVGGIAEHWRNVSDAAAQGLKGILGVVDERIRRAASDLAEDDERVSRLLYYLGALHEPVRRELETSGEERLRLRALRAVLSIKRPAELTRRFLADPSPLVRIEALEGGAGLTLADLERSLTDPSPELRLAAAKKLRWAKDSAAFVAAARVETDPRVRIAFIDGLVARPLTEDVVRALVGYLADGGYTEDRAAERLKEVDDPGVAAAIAARILTCTNEMRLATLVGHRHLLRHVPEIREPLEHMRRCTPSGWLRHVLEEALGRATAPAHGPSLSRLGDHLTARQAGAGLEPLPPGPLSPMLTRGPEDLRLAFSHGAVAVVGLRESVPAANLRPEYAVLHVDCPDCSAQMRLEGPVQWQYR